MRLFQTVDTSAYEADRACSPVSPADCARAQLADRLESLEWADDPEDDPDPGATPAKLENGCG